MCRSPAATTAPIIVAAKYIGITSISPEAMFGPKVRAGFIDAPVYGPKKNANTATTSPTTIPTM